MNNVICKLLLSLGVLLVADLTQSRAANFVWTNSTGGNWANAANWSPNLVPGSNDNAFITTGGSYTITINSDAGVNALTVGGSSGTQTLSQIAGIFTVNAASTLATNAVLSISGGVFTGTGDVTILGALSWSAGNMDGTGRTILGSEAIATFNGASIKGLNRTFQNSGTVIYNGSALVFGFSSPATGTINNLAGAVFNVTGEGDFAQSTAAAHAFNNSGTFNKSGTNTSTDFTVPFHNHGTANVNSGTLVFNGGGTNNAALVTAAGTVVTFTGNYFHPVGASISGGGAINFNAGTHDIASQLLTTGTVSCVTLVNFNTPQTLRGLVLSSGALAGTSDVTVTGTFNWSAGNMGGTGRTILSNGATAIFASGSIKGLNRTFDNSGTVTYSGMFLTFGFSAPVPGVINNLPDGIFNVTSDGDFAQSSTAAHAFNNSGTFNKSGAGTGTDFNSVPFNNVGTVNPISGTLNLNAGGTNTSAITVPSGATLGLGGMFSHPMGSSIGGAGTINFVSGTHNFFGQFLPSGIVNFNSGAITITNSMPTVAASIAGATVDFNAPQTLSSLTLSSGTLQGSGDVNITGTFNWSGGTMGGAGHTALGNAGTASLSSANLKGLNRTFDNSGTVTYGGTLLTHGLFAAAAGVINNLPGGIFNVTGDGDFSQSSSAAHAFNNSGTFNKSAGNATDFNGVPFNNSGSVNLTVGTMAFNAGCTNNTVIDLATGTTLNIASVSLLPASGSFTGGGAITFNSGTHTIAGQFLTTGTVSIGGATVDFNAPQALAGLTLSSGTLQGSGNVTITGALNWSAGTMAGAGRTILAGGGTASLSSGSPKGLNRTFDNSGTVTYSGTILIFGNGAAIAGVINNLTGAVFSVTSDGDFSQSSTAAHAFNNSGTFAKSGAGTSTDFNSVTFNNSGEVNLLSGTMNLNGGGSNTSVIDVPAGATLGFGATFSHLAGSVLGGAGTNTFGSGTHNFIGQLLPSGTVNFNGGTITISNTMSVGVVNIGSATVNFNAAQSISNLTISGGGTLTGSGDVTVAGTFNWSSGIMGGGGRTILSSTASGNLTTTSSKGINRSLENHGTVNYSGTALTFGQTAATPGIINNIGTFNVTADGDFSQSSAAAHAFNNSGTFNKSGAGTSSDFNGVPFNNSNVLHILSGTLLPAGIRFPDAAVLQSDEGATLRLTGTSLTGSTTNALQWVPLGRVLFDSFGTRNLEVMSSDLGNIPSAYTNNFAYGTIELASGATLILTNGSDNVPGDEALYVDTLIVPVGTTLNLSNFHVYVRNTQIGGTITNGTISVAVGEQFADLQVESVSALASASVLEPITVNWTVRNATNASSVTPTTNWQDRIVISPDAIVGNFDDRTLATIPHSGELTIGAAYSTNATVILPGDLQGTLNLFVVADSANSVYEFQFETNNNSTSRAIAASVPDLVISNLVAAPVGTAGQPFPISWSVTNLGPGTAWADWSDRIYLSTNATFEGADTQLGSESVTTATPLLPGAGYAISRNVTLPANFFGSNYLIVFADGSLNQLEAVQTNNTAVVPIFINAADLQVTGLDITPANLLSGTDIVVRWNDTNSGIGTASGFWFDQIVVSNLTTGAKLVDAGIYCDANGTNAIGTGQSRARQFSFRLPDGPVGAGQLVFRVRTDLYSSIPEFNPSGTAESNNLAIATRTSTLLPYPDLQVTNLAVAPTNLQSGAALVFTWDLTNSGDASVTRSFYDKLTIRNRTTAETFVDTFLYYDPASTNGPIASGQSKTRQHAFQLPNGTRGAGELEFTIASDIYNHIFENNAGGTGESNNVAVLVRNVPLAPSPDLTVSNVFGSTNGLPGQQVDIAWTTINQGNTLAAAPWSEQVFLSDDPIVGNDVYLGSFFRTTPLGAGASTNRIERVTLPAFSAGNKFFVVKVDSGNQVFELNETNNAAVAEQQILLPASLTLAFSTRSFSEAAGSNASIGTVVRNTVGTNALAVTLSLSDTNVVSVPEVVTIPAGQVAASFSVAAIDDLIVEGNRSFTLTASAVGFNPVTDTLTAVENDARLLSLQLGATNVVENAGPAGVVGIVTRNAETTTALVVTLTSDQPSKLTVPTNVTLGIGQRSAVFLIDAVDNNFLDGDIRMNVQASASNYSAVSAGITVTDDDTVTLALNLSITNVAEGGASPATIGTLTRSLVNNRNLAVLLSSTPSGHVLLPSRVTIPTNEASASFNINVLDDSVALGARSINIVAKALGEAGTILESSAGSASLRIQDNDGPTLTLSVSSALVAEGANVTGRVTRNTATSNELIVLLSSSLPEEAAVPASVTILSNQTFATFNIAGLADNESDGIKSVTIIASAPGLNSGSVSLNVSDIDVPDLRVASAGVPTNGLTDTFMTVTWTTTNSGLAPASGSWVDRIYLSKDKFLGSDTLLGSASFNGTLAVGQSYSRTQQVAIPSSPGDFWILIATDDGSSVIEGSEVNNTLASAITITPSYRATATTDVNIAANGTLIPIRGHAYNTVDGSAARFKFVTTRISVQGSRRVFTSITDGNGDFQLTFKPLPTEAGGYTIGADHPLVIEDANQDQFTILGMRASPERLNLKLVPNEPLSGQIEVRNLGDVPITGLTATPTAPAGLNVQLSISNQLSGMSTGLLYYTITSTITQQANANILFHMMSGEGVTLDVVASASIMPLRPQLAANPPFLSRGVLRGTQTVVSVEVVNNGGAPSGDLRVMLPALPWMSLVSESNIASLLPGQKTTLTLALNPPADLPLQRYDGNLAVVGGATSLSVPFQFRALSDAVGDLLVTVTDEYTFFVATAPKVTNATVRVRDPISGAIVAEGNSGSSGKVFLANIMEGVYSLEVTAERHSAFRGPVTIVPGITNVAEPFISRQTVSYNWNVVPIEIQDTYKVVVEPTFEADVPIPTVVIEDLRIAPLVVSGMETHFEIRIRNEGLIAANNVKLSVPQNSRFIVTPLVEEIGVLPAKGSVSIPVSIRHRGTPAGKRIGLRSSFSAAKAEDGCEVEVHSCLEKIKVGVAYTYTCGPNNNLKVQPIDLTPICTAQDTYKCLEKILGVNEAAAVSGNLLKAPCEILAAVLECIFNLSECEKALLLTGCKTLTAGPIGFASSLGDSLGCICDLISRFLDWLDLSFDEVELTGGLNGGGSTFVGVITWGNTPSANPDCYVTGGGGADTPSKSASSRTGPKTTAPGNVCARVRVRLEQEAVMTRSAFLGTLEIDNDGLDSITGIRVSLDVRDATENSVSGRFVIRDPELTGLADVDGGGSIAAGASGSAKYTFIPTRDAAPTAPAVYHMGGTIRYIENGQEVVAPLLSSIITVFPDARLELKYFQQRDVFSDDPNTLEKEPAEPFALGLLVKNTGAGAAKNFRITSAQPKIVENEKGLLVDFKIIGTQIGTQALVPTLTANLGTIPPGQSQVGQWLFTSSLQGKFTEYAARFEHVDSLGSSNLSLIDSVEIHELIHAVRADRPGDDAVPDFLVNDDPDPNNFPDRLYLSDGTIAVVNAALNPTPDGPANPSDLVVQLTATMTTGWNYFRVSDPGASFQLYRVTRPDGRELRVGDNVWQTDRSFPASQTGVLREHLLHLLDFDGTGSYTLHYRVSDAIKPGVFDIADVLPNPRTNSVAFVDVVFSETIDLSTFDHSDVTLALNGGSNLVNNSVTVALLSNTTYRIQGLAGLTVADGNYELRVLSGGILDFGGNATTNSVSESWAKASSGPVIVSLQSVVPNPRNVPVATLDVTFSQPIDPATFDATDLTLTRNGGANLSSALTVAAISDTTFRISGLATVTAASGTYVLMVQGNGVSGIDASTGTGARTEQWVTDADGPTIVALEHLATNPRNTVVLSLEVTFSEAIDPATFDFRDITLTRNGGANLITSAVQVTPLSSTSFQIANFNSVVASEGTYALTVNGATVTDLAGNSGSGSAAELWIMDITAPVAPTNLVIVPDRGISATDGLSNTNNATLNGTVSETNLTVRVFDVTTGTDFGEASIAGLTFTRTLALSGAGTHRIRLSATDAAGNVSANSFFDLFVDLQAPTLALSSVSPNPRTNSVSFIDVSSSEALNTNTFDYTDLMLTLDGGTNNLITNSVTIQIVSSNLYRITGLAPLTDALGNYGLTLNSGTIEDHAGNSGVGLLSNSWQRLGANTAPSLNVISNQIIPEKNLLTFTASATDTDAPPNVLTFSLDAGAPTGAAIHPASGIFTWTPTELQGPAVQSITVRVTDNGSPNLSSASTFSVTVNEVNEPPTLNSISNRLAFVGFTLSVTNFAADPDRPANQLTFTLGTNAPVGAQIHPTSGLFTWAPTVAQAGTTNHIPIIVTDNGSPPLSDTKIFTVIVRNQFDVFIGSAISHPGQTGSVPVFIAGNLDVTNVTFTLEAPAARLINLTLINPAPQIGLLSLLSSGGDNYVLQFGAVSGQMLPKNVPMARLSFASVSNQPSSFVPLRISNFDAHQPDGTTVLDPTIHHGRIVMIGDEPLLEAFVVTNAHRSILLYGTPGRNYALESTTNLVEPIWTVFAEDVLTNQLRRYDTGPTNRPQFFRAREQ